MNFKKIFTVLMLIPLFFVACKSGGEQDFIPQWVFDLGFEEPQGLTLNKSRSQIMATEKDGFSAILLIYKGDYETSMKEAEKLAQKLNLHINNDFKQSLERYERHLKYAKENNTALPEPIKGIIYMNDAMEKNLPDAKYYIALNVDPAGKFGLNIKDMEAYRESHPEEFSN